MDESCGREDGGMIVMRDSRLGILGLVPFDRAPAMSFDLGQPGGVDHPWPTCGHGEAPATWRPLPWQGCGALARARGVELDQHLARLGMHRHNRAWRGLHRAPGSCACSAAQPAGDGCLGPPGLPGRIPGLTGDPGRRSLRTGQRPAGFRSVLRARLPRRGPIRSRMRGRASLAGCLP